MGMGTEMRMCSKVHVLGLHFFARMLQSGTVTMGAAEVCGAATLGLGLDKYQAWYFSL